MSGSLASSVSLEATLQEATQLLAANTQRTPKQALLKFSFLGCPFHATIDYEDGAPEVVLEANLGDLFFTAENPDFRASAIDLINEANSAFKCRYAITISGGIRLIQRTLLDEGAGDSDIVEALTIAMLDLRTHVGHMLPLLKPSVVRSGRA